METLKLQKRTQSGKGTARRLRTEGMIPGVVYGAGKEPTAVSVSAHDVMMIAKKGGFYAQIINAEIDGKKEKVLPRELQRDPVKGRYLHLDLLRVDLKKAVNVSVPVTFLDENKAPGIKAGGILQVARTEVEVSCRADSIPETLEVSVAGLKVGDTIRYSNLTLPKGVSFVDEEDRTVASIAGTRATAGGATTEEAEVEETTEA